MSSFAIPLNTAFTRRRFLAGSGGLALTALAACGGSVPTARATAIGPTGPEVLAAEQRRIGSRATTASYQLVAAPARIDLGGPVVDTWAYGGAIPGTPITANVGQILEVAVGNQLPDPTSVHWHGLALRNDMDGVPGLSQPDPIAGGASMTYRFALAHSGTYWLHPHVGAQLDRGLYAPLIVNDPAESGDYDLEHVVVCDDWLDGTGRNPADVLDRLRAQGAGMGGGGMGDGDRPAAAALGGDAGDVEYPHYLINGRVSTAPETFDAKPGQRIRLRFINAGGDTAFRIALADHRMLVTHTDGWSRRTRSCAEPRPTSPATCSQNDVPAGP